MINATIDEMVCSTPADFKGYMVREFLTEVKTDSETNGNNPEIPQHRDLPEVTTSPIISNYVTSSNDQIHRYASN